MRLGCLLTAVLANVAAAVPLYAASANHASLGLGSALRRSECGQRIDVLHVRGGAMLAGLNPFGYKISERGETFLEYEGSRDSDLGKLLSSLKQRKTTSRIKSEWLELMRYSKTGQSVRIYKDLDAMLALLLKMGLID